MTDAVLSPRARRELTEATRWISRSNRAAARGLRDAAALAASRIGQHPAISSVPSGLLPEPYRFLSLTGFPYVIVYNGDRDPPLIVFVLHTARDLKRALGEIE